MKKRAAYVNKWLWDRPERNIAVVSHGHMIGFLIDKISRHSTIHKVSMNLASCLESTRTTRITSQHLWERS